MASYDDESLERIPPTLLPGEKEHVLIVQDETVFHTNEYRRRTWLMQDQQPIRKKGGGRAVHVSDFICETIGRIKISEEQIHEQLALPAELRLAAFEARKIIYPGKGFDAWWDLKQLIEQVRIAVSIFGYTHPSCVGISFLIGPLHTKASQRMPLTSLLNLNHHHQMSEPPPDSPPRTFSLEEVTPHMPGKAEDLMKRLGFHRPFLSAVEYRDALASKGLPPLRCAREVASVAIKMKWPFCDIREAVHDFPLNDYSHMLDEIAYTLDPAHRPDRLEILGKGLSLCFLDA